MNNEEFEITETKPGPYGTTNFVACVDISTDCRLECAGYITRDIDEARFTTFNNPTVETLVLFAAWAVTHKSQIINLVIRHHAEGY